MSGKKKNKKLKLEKQLSRYDLWKRWKGTLVTTFSIIFGTVTGFVFALTAEIYIALILIGALIFVCLAAIVFDQIYTKANVARQKDYDMHYDWSVDSDLMICVQEKIAKCLRDYIAPETMYGGELQKDDIVCAMDNYYANLKCALDAYRDIFVDRYKTEYAEERVFSVRFMFKSIFDDKMTILWADNSYPRHIGDRVLNSDLYENTGAGDMINNGIKTVKIVPNTKQLKPDDPYFEDKNCSKMLIPIKSKQDKIQGIIAIKKSLLDDEEEFFTLSDRRKYFWEKILQGISEYVSMIKSRWDFFVVTVKDKRLLSVAYAEFIKKNNFQLENAIIL